MFAIFVHLLPMKGLRKKIALIVLKTGLLLGWLVFCAVQTLFNYEIASHAAYKEILSVQDEGNGYQGFTAAKKKHPQKEARNGIRLNKRFFPETTPTIESIVVEAPQEHFNIQFDVAYCQPLVPSPLFLIQELRGPPVAA